MKALDIDGIVCPFTAGVWVPTMNKTLHKNIQIVGEGDEPTMDYCSKFGITKKEAGYVWGSKHFLTFLEEVEPIQKGLELVWGYEKLGTEYCFITSRGSHDNSPRSLRIRDITRQWVKDKLNSDAPIYFEKKLEKQLLAKELGVTIMYEDHPVATTLLANEGIKVFMPVYAYNEHVMHDNIFPVEDWLD